MSSSFQYKKHAFLDNIELFSSENESEYFPFHFHDYYCISLITKGTEQLQTLTGSHYAMTGSISVTQANEVHKNSSVDDAGYSYRTCYVNPDVLRHFNNGKSIDQLMRNIDDPKLFSAFSRLFTDEESNLNNYKTGLEGLTLYATCETGDRLPSFELIDELTENIPFVPISLDWLAKEFCMSKFHFVRVFKSVKGITPQAYIMLKRLSNAKRMLLLGTEVKEVVFLNGFYDSAHLNSAFKRFFGITLAMIKNSNIIQSVDCK